MVELANENQPSLALKREPRDVGNRQRAERGASMVELMLVAPLAFLLLLGIVVVGIVVTHQMQLNQGVANSARAVAICGTALEQNPNNTPVGTLPNGNSCIATNIQSYINQQVDGVSPSLGQEATVTVTGSTSWTKLGDACSPGEIVQVTITYQQALFVPLIGYAIGNGGTDSRQLQAFGEATC
jgi:Flp pilus assembly protein TadG